MTIKDIYNNVDALDPDELNDDSVSVFDAHIDDYVNSAPETVDEG
jgi:hypothetical protein